MIYRALAEQYGFTPEQVGRMTLYQVKMLTCDEALLKGTRRMSLADARAAGVVPPKGETQSVRPHTSGGATPARRRLKKMAGG
jgi:hypothetical protein